MSGAAPTAAPTAIPSLVPLSPEGSGGFSDQWYAAEAELQEGGADDSGKRREPTRVIRTDGNLGRDLSGIWVWVALAVGLLAFLVGGGFYWQRLQRDARDRAAHERVRQMLQEADQSPRMPQHPAPPGPSPQQAPNPLPAPPGLPQPRFPGPAPGSLLAPPPPPPPPPS